MKRQKPSRKRLLSLCAEVHPDDGADPKDFFGKQNPHGKSDRKVRQLCSQTGEALSYVLSGECNDDLLRNLEIMRVEPAPDSSRLLVVVRVNPPDAEARRLRDESPAAYKDIHGVMRAQRELTRIVRTLRPLLSYKGA
ncbi:MAG: RtcB family protein [Pirellulales bacterium]